MQGRVYLLIVMVIGLLLVWVPERREVDAQGVAPPASVIPSSFASVTYTATAGGVAIPAAALTVAGVQVKRCTGVAETAVMRYRVDGQANLVSGTVGRPVAINEAIEINGFQALMQMRGFSTSGTAVVQWTCWR